MISECTKRNILKKLEKLGIVDDDDNEMYITLKTARTGSVYISIENESVLPCRCLDIRIADHKEGYNNWSYDVWIDERNGKVASNVEKVVRAAIEGISGIDLYGVLKNA